MTFMSSFDYSIDKPMPRYMEHNGVKYELTLYFDRVIRFLELISDKENKLSCTDRLEIGYDWFVKSPKKAGIVDKLIVVDRICREHIADPRSKNNQRSDERTAFNYIADSGYIYAAFRQYYGINLFEEQGRLTWWEFRYMFDCLPPESKIKEIMFIRTRKIPESNGFNAEEIIRIKEQQDYYFLPENWEEIQKESNNALSGMFDALMKKAEKGGGKVG